MIVAIANFFKIRELGRFARIRRTAIVLALAALAGVLLFGVLPGLLLAVGLSLVELLRRVSAPPVAVLVRDPASGAWGNEERHPGWAPPPAGVVVVGVEGPLFYANTSAVKNRVLVLAAPPETRVVVLDLARNDELDVQALDMLGELADGLAVRGAELRLASVHAPVLELLQRAGVAERMRVDPTLESALT